MWSHFCEKCTHLFKPKLEQLINQGSHSFKACPTPIEIFWEYADMCEWTMDEGLQHWRMDLWSVEKLANTAEAVYQAIQSLRCTKHSQYVAAIQQTT